MELGDDIMTSLDSNESLDQRDNEELIQLSMQILLHAGDGRKRFVTAMGALAERDFETARTNIKAAHDEINLAHTLQTETLQKEASGEQIRYSTLFAHAQDTFMTAKSEILIGEQLIRIMENFNQGS